jgi:hypothetical protein
MQPYVRIVRIDLGGAARRADTFTAPEVTEGLGTVDAREIKSRDDLTK